MPERCEISPLPKDEVTVAREVYRGRPARLVTCTLAILLQRRPKRVSE